MKFEFITLDAVMKTKLLYGMKSAQLREPELKRLEVFYLRALRKYSN